MKKEEKLLHAIGGVDEHLIEEALEVRIRRKPAILRWVAVAACVCLLLASPAVAAMVGSLVELWPSDKYVSYYINERITIDSLSEEVAEAFDGQKKTVLRYQMDTLEEAEELSLLLTEPSDKRTKRALDVRPHSEDKPSKGFGLVPQDDDSRDECCDSRDNEDNRIRRKE